MITCGQIVRFLDESGCWREAEVLLVEDEQSVSLDLDRRDNNSIPMTFNNIGELKATLKAILKFLEKK
jgi:hypothetical protein